MQQRGDERGERDLRPRADHPVDPVLGERALGDARVAEHADRVPRRPRRHVVDVLAVEEGAALRRVVGHPDDVIAARDAGREHVELCEVAA